MLVSTSTHMTDKHVLCLSEKGMIIFALVLKAHTAEAEIDIIVTKVRRH